MKTEEIKKAIRGLPADQQKLLGRQATKYAFRRCQTRIALLVFLILMIAGSIAGDILSGTHTSSKWPLLVASAIGFVLFFIVFESQRKKSAIKDLKHLQQGH